MDDSRPVPPDPGWVISPAFGVGPDRWPEWPWAGDPCDRSDEIVDALIEAGAWD